MSFTTQGVYSLVACDLCGARGAVGDTRFRLMRRDQAGKTHHLCPDCRVWAEWCGAHQQYHRPDDLHRCACADCGGLFTARVRQRIERCPSCQRAHAPAPARAPHTHAAMERAPRGLAGLVAALTRHR